MSSRDRPEATSQVRVVWSRLVLAKVFPSGEKVSAFTSRVWPKPWLCSRDDSKSHARGKPPAETAVSCTPRLSNAKPVTQLVGPERAFHSSKVAGSHKRTTRSLPAVASSLPSPRAAMALRGISAARFCPWVCPLKVPGPLSGWSKFHTKAMPSAQPAASFLPRARPASDTTGVAEPRTSGSALPVLASYSRTTGSLVAAASHWPSPANASALTGPGQGVGVATGWAWPGFHTKILPEASPVATKALPGAIATLVIGLPCPSKVCLVSSVWLSTRRAVPLSEPTTARVGESVLLATHVTAPPPGFTSRASDPSSPRKSASDPSSRAKREVVPAPAATPQILPSPPPASSRLWSLAASSHQRTCRSNPPVARRVPSGLKASALGTSSNACTTKGLPSGNSYTRAVRSSEMLARRLPSALIESPVTASVCPSSDRCTEPSRVSISNTRLGRAPASATVRLSGKKVTAYWLP